MDSKLYYTIDPNDDDVVEEQALVRGLDYNQSYRPTGRKFKKWRIPACIYTDKNTETEFIVDGAPPEDRRIVLYQPQNFIPFYYVLME